MTPVTSQFELEAMLAEATGNGLVYHLVDSDERYALPDLAQITSFYAGYLIFSLPGTVPCLTCGEGFDINIPDLKWSTLVVQAAIPKPAFALARGICQACMAMNATTLHRDIRDALALQFPGVRLRTATHRETLKRRGVR